MQDVADAHIATLERMPAVGSDGFVLSASKTFAPDEAIELKWGEAAFIRWDPSPARPSDLCRLRELGRDGFAALIDRCRCRVSALARWVSELVGAERAALPSLNQRLIRFPIRSLD